MLPGRLLPHFSCFGTRVSAAPVLQLAGDSATIKVGILNDMNGPFADQSGRGSVVAAQMAAEDFAAAGRRPEGRDPVGRSPQQA